MKNLDAYMKGLYVSLEGISEEAQKRLSNLKGYQISECCGCDCEYNCPNCEQPQTVVSNQFGKFNSEQEIIRELDSKPKVSTLHEIHYQFGRFTFRKNIKRLFTEPLYFGNKDYSIFGAYALPHRENGDMPQREAEPEKLEELYDVPTPQNKKIYKVVTDIVDTYELDCPTIETKINGEVQVYAIKTTGTNGKENSIKSSLEEVADILGKLEKKSEIIWSQVLDVAIDNIDDIYTFVITFVLDPEKVRETINQPKNTSAM